MHRELSHVLEYVTALRLLEGLETKVGGILSPLWPRTQAEACKTLIIRFGAAIQDDKSELDRPHAQFLLLQLSCLLCATETKCVVNAESWRTQGASFSGRIRIQTPLRGCCTFCLGDGAEDQERQPRYSSRWYFRVLHSGSLPIHSTPGQVSARACEAGQSLAPTGEDAGRLGRGR